MKKDKTVSKEEYIAELHKAIDLQTGLTLAQKKAAELSAQGLPDTKIAKMVGAHFNTVKNWRKTKPAFRKIEKEFVARGDRSLVVKSVKDTTISGLDNEMAKILPRAIEALNDLLVSNDTKDSVKYNVAKFVMTTCYESALRSEGFDDTAVSELRARLAAVNN